MGKPVGTWCLLALLFTACIKPAAATDATIKGNVFITDTANFVNVSSIIAGEALVIDFLLTDQATNATLGNILGFCVALRSNGPSQCQYTVQLAPGTLQVAGLVTFPPQPNYIPLTTGLLAVTGGTGLYTGATGLYQEVNPNANISDAVPTNGVVITVTY